MKAARVTYLLFFFISILAFYSVKIDYDQIGVFGLLSFGIPICLLLNLVFLLYFLIRKRIKWLLLTLVLFLLGFDHIQRTIQVNITQTEGEIKVLNANVRIFNVYKHLRDEKRTSSLGLIDWIAHYDADIMILQEYYNLDTSRFYASTAQISKNYPYKFLEVALYNRANAEFGQVIYSKYPIINSSKIAYKNRTFNQAIFADIVINGDTVRVYNIHLESMKIEERKLFNDKNENEEIVNKVKDTSGKLMKGFRKRSAQVKVIVDHMKNCPHPIILGADMNDTPYSYAYNEFDKLLNNTFEEKGNGFGFTFNGKLFFLRIDNLFASDELEAKSFNVHREMEYSDHFPISATYTLKK